MTRNITKLEKTLAEKEGFMALVHTRLGNRAQRPGIELCKDLVETSLVNEVGELRMNVVQLQQTMAEVKLKKLKFRMRCKNSSVNCNSAYMF